MSDKLDEVKELKQVLERTIADLAVKLLKDYGVYIDYISIKYNTQHTVGDDEIKFFSDVYVNLRL